MQKHRSYSVDINGIRAEEHTVALSSTTYIGKLERLRCVGRALRVFLILAVDSLLVEIFELVFVLKMGEFVAVILHL